MSSATVDISGSGEDMPLSSEGEPAQRGCFPSRVCTEKVWAKEIRAEAGFQVKGRFGRRSPALEEMQGLMAAMP